MGIGNYLLLRIEWVSVDIESNFGVLQFIYEKPFAIHHMKNLFLHPAVIVFHS